MSEQEFPNEVPEPYRSRYGVAELKDPDDLGTDDSVKKDTRAFAEASVQAIHQLIFPTHGITSG
jgi:hypothetical protein